MCSLRGFSIEGNVLFKFGRDLSGWFCRALLDVGIRCLVPWWLLGSPPGRPRLCWPQPRPFWRPCDPQFRYVGGIDSHLEDKHLMIFPYREDGGGAEPCREAGFLGNLYSLSGFLV